MMTKQKKRLKEKIILFKNLMKMNIKMKRKLKKSFVQQMRSKINIKIHQYKVKQMDQNYNIQRTKKQYMKYCKIIEMNKNL